MSWAAEETKIPASGNPPQAGSQTSEATLRQDIVDTRCCPLLQRRASESTRNCTSPQRTPSKSPRLLRPFLQHRWFASRLRFGEVSQEGCNLLRPTPYHFSSEDHQLCPLARSHGLQVGAFKSPPYRARCHSIHISNSPENGAITTQRGYKGGIHGQLSTTMQQQTTHHNLQKTSTIHGHWEVRVANPTHLSTPCRLVLGISVMPQSR